MESRRQPDRIALEQEVLELLGDELRARRQDRARRARERWLEDYFRRRGYPRGFGRSR